MSDHSLNAEIRKNEKLPVQQPLCPDGDTANCIEQKLNGGASASFPLRTVIAKRKAKRKDDGPLEIVCGWVVAHQIGILERPDTQLLPRD